MNKKTKRTNGTDLDTNQMAQMRAAVIEQELSARSWKAFYEKMYYSLESEKLELPYTEYQERAKKRIEEERARMEEFMANLNKEIELKNEEDPLGSVKLEPVETEVVETEPPTKVELG